MLSGHVGIIYVMGFDEGFACTPNGGSAVDCVDSGDERRDLGEGLGIRI